jgi:hypothetical protein
MKEIVSFIRRWKYEVLLFALGQHLFAGILLTDFEFYTHVIWPLNMLILGVASIGVFMGKSRLKTIIKNILFVIVLLLPIGLPFFEDVSYYFQMLNILYILFFLYIFWEIMRFLVKPGYINADLISAAACGYFLLIEISVFLLQFCVYNDPSSFNGVTMTNSAEIFMDLVYFCSITFTSIGFGDITPNTHSTKLIASLIGIVWQFYSVILVGILISKFASRTSEK